MNDTVEPEAKVEEEAKPEPEPEPKPEPEAQPEPIPVTMPEPIPVPVPMPVPVPQPEPKPEPKPETNSVQQPTIYIDTKPSVTFSQEHIMFDSDTLENNEIHDIPFAEAELRMDDDTEIESVDILDEMLPMEADETL